MSRTPTEVATPTIAETLAEFLAAHEQRLAPRTFARYREVVDLLRHCLNDYACQTLAEDESRLFDRLYKGAGKEHREYCQIFGPEKILPEVGSFLSYFMVRKVFAGRDLLRSAAAVTKKLAKWLAEKGYVTGDAAEATADGAAEAARELPAARDLLGRLQAFCQAQPASGKLLDEVEGYLEITRIGAGALWLAESLGRKQVGPVALPRDLCRRCERGWTISGIVGRTARGWRLLEVWNVYTI